jgi:hypothetical protein
MSEKEKTKLLLHDAPELTSLLADLKAYMKLLREAEILIHTHTLYIYMYIICIYIYIADLKAYMKLLRETKILKIQLHIVTLQSEYTRAL